MAKPSQTFTWIMGIFYLQNFDSNLFIDNNTLICRFRKIKVGDKFATKEEFIQLISVYFGMLYLDVTRLLEENWMLFLKPEPTKRAKKIFQEACGIENMEAKFGRTLSKNENRVKRFILTQSSILGRIPFIDEIRKEFRQFQKEKVDAILSELDRVDAIHLDNEKTTIVAAYPFSGLETSHQVSLKRKGFKRVYAMCAIDALGMSFMFNCDVSIESLCNHCGERIEIEIKDNEIIILNPTNPVVWCDMEYSCCAATSLCKNTNFFSSEKHYEGWQKGNPIRKGNLLPIQEAFYLGKLFFEKRLE